MTTRADYRYANKHLRVAVQAMERALDPMPFCEAQVRLSQLRQDANDLIDFIGAERDKLPPGEDTKTPPAAKVAEYQNIYVLHEGRKYRVCFFRGHRVMLVAAQLTGPRKERAIDIRGRIAAPIIEEARKAL